MAKTRKTAEERTQELIEAGYSIATKNGIKKVTRAAVARATETSVGLTNLYFAGREGLRAAVLEHAAKAKDAHLLADAQLAGFELPPMTRVLAADVKRLVKVAA